MRSYYNNGSAFRRKPPRIAFALRLHRVLGFRNPTERRQKIQDGRNLNIRNQPPIAIPAAVAYIHCCSNEMLELFSQFGFGVESLLPAIV
ncbi:hypothetical protein CEXT_518511 [Caerostris extrusa]|uniref:Uncharacterized protein n=1 Tax=Caerostris extrusa TaxID=172846 RepID=A0AAV4TYJ0_CAEEX|nr:hypothetical protein CEXT_518511 [Caerostris extrusa]